MKNNSMTKSKVVLLSIVVVAIFAFYKFNLSEYLTLEYLKSQREMFERLYSEHKTFMIASFSAIYIISTALSFPGAAILTLAAGAIFGLGLGTLIVSFASTIGATLAFLTARLLFRDTIQKKFAEKIASIDEGIKREGAFYLFTLRVLPIVPFFVVNLVMGVTPISVGTYFIVSQIGMLPGTLAYVNAGTQLSQLESLRGIISLPMLASFAALGILPLMAKFFINFLKARKVFSRYKKPKKYDYNLIAIGAGAAGLVSAYIAAAVKAKVALIEKNHMGGDCLYTGCVPSKAFIQSAKVVSHSKRAKEFGLKAQVLDVDFKAVMERVQRVIKKIEPHDSVERYSGLGVECIKGTAKILSPFSVEVNGKVLTTKNIVVATGAAPIVPSFSGLEKITYYTTENIWELREQPKRLLVLGGGPIGCELSQSFQRLGTQVLQVEMADRLLLREDPEISQLVTDKFKQEGIQLFLGHKAKAFGRDGKGSFLMAESGTSEVRIDFDVALFALGRKARTKGFGLEELGIEVSKQGTIDTNEFMQTKYPNIYVCGDATAPYQFTHTAAHQAWFCAVNALFSPFKKFKVDYRVIPWATFTEPEIARVGLNEQEAKAKNIPYEITTYSLDDLDRAIADEEDHGIVKVLTVPGKDQIIGCTIAGAHAGDVIIEYIAAMKHGIGLNKILGTIHIYPTWVEANKYAAGNWKKAHSPKQALVFLEKFHAWRRG